jgi:hypothetical protein
MPLPEDDALPEEDVFPGDDMLPEDEPVPEEAEDDEEPDEDGPPDDVAPMLGSMPPSPWPSDPVAGRRSVAPCVQPATQSRSGRVIASAPAK